MAKNNNNSDTEKVLRCAFYIRVSSQRQLEGVSLEAQENALYEYIKNHSYRYILTGKHHVYVDEAKSGKTSDRPAFQRMIQAAENREFDVILVWKLDRFFRNMSEASKYIKKLKEKHKVGVTSITQDFDTEGPFGAAIFAIMMAFAELESNLITERTILGKSQKASEGKFVGGGIPPYGYYLDENRVLHIHEKEAEVVRRIFKMFGKELLGVKDISPLLNAEHQPIRIIPRGKDEKGEKKQIKISYFWSSSFIYKILNNEMYYGEYYYGKTSVGKGNLSKKDWEKINEKKENGEMIDMTDYTPKALLTIPCPPILSDDPEEAKQIFLDTQAVLALGRGRNQPKGYKYIFSGKLISGESGYKFSGYKNKANNYYYRIHKDKTKVNYIKRGVSNISEKELVGYVMDHMEKILKKPKSELADMYNIKLQNGNEQGLKENELDLISKEITNLERKKRNSYEDKQNNIIDLNEYIVIKNEYEEKIRLLEERKKQITRLIQDEVQNFNNALRIKKVLLKFEEAFKSLSYEEQKEFCELIVSEITIYKDTKIITLAFSEGLLDFFEKEDSDDDSDGGVIPYSKGGKNPKGGGNSGNNPMSKIVKSFTELESNNLDGGGNSQGYIQDSSLSPVKNQIPSIQDGILFFRFGVYGTRIRTDSWRILEWIFHSVRRAGRRRRVASPIARSNSFLIFLFIRRFLFLKCQKFDRGGGKCDKVQINLLLIILFMTTFIVFAYILKFLISIFSSVLGFISAKARIPEIKEFLANNVSSNHKMWILIISLPVLYDVLIEAIKYISIYFNSTILISLLFITNILLWIIGIFLGAKAILGINIQENKTSVRKFVINYIIAIIIFAFALTFIGRIILLNLY